MAAERLVVVGSGASGVHFALSLLQKGRAVTMIDVGRTGPEPPLPDATFRALKRRLPDPVGYFLGSEYQGALLPGTESEYYGVPPSREFVFSAPEELKLVTRGFEPLFSFARGGLAEAWTGGCYPFNDEDLASFPFSYREIEPYYVKVAERIGLTGARDDLARFLPVHDGLLEPLRLDTHSRLLLQAYAARKAKINGVLRAYLGRTRVATLTRDRGDRRACAYLARCLWGCPLGALYTPSQTLQECLRLPGFTYLDGLKAGYFRLDGRDRVTSVVAHGSGGETEIAVDRLILAAGTLCSAELLLRSVWRQRNEIVRLPGLMDNRQILMPFLNPRMIGKGIPDESYQYHLVGLGIESDDPDAYVHGQITTLKSALLHPIVQSLPLDLRTAAYLTRALRSALGVVNLNLSDSRRSESLVTLDAASPGSGARLVVHYEPPAGEAARLKQTVRRARRVLRSLGCVVPPGMMHVRPMGASVHYSGTLPMSSAHDPWTTDRYGRSRGLENLYFADGSTFPSLPSKNLTFTLMANAARIAEEAF